MHRLFITALACLISVSLFGQGWIKTFTTYEESLNYSFSIKKTGSDGFVMTGATDANSGEWNIFIIKIDNYGNEQWRKIIDGGSGLDDIGFDSYFDNDLIYVTGQLENDFSFLKVFNMNGDLIDENAYDPGPGYYNRGSSIIKEFTDYDNSSKLLLFNNYGEYGPEGVSSILFVDKVSLDSLSIFSLPDSPINGNQGNQMAGIIDVKLTYEPIPKGKDFYYYVNHLYYLNRNLGSFNNKEDTDFYITGSQFNSYSGFYNYPKIFSYGGFNDDFAYDFEIIDNSTYQPSAIIVGATESYGNSSYNQPVPYIVKTNPLDLWSENEHNSIDWEIILDYKGEAKLITKLNNNNYLILIWSQEELDAPLQLIEINVNGEIICESSIDLNEFLETSQFYPNTFSRFNAIIPIENNEVLLLGNFALDGASSPSSNYSQLINPNSFGHWNEIFLIKTECGGSISSINKPEEISKKKLNKVVDALGREVNHTTNQILFYIYDDGSVEKKFIVE